MVSPKDFFTRDYLKKRTRPPRVLFHFTRSTKHALSILKEGYIKGFPHLSLTENPAMSGPTGPVFVVDVKCLARKGVHLEPYEHRTYSPSEAEWRVGKMGKAGKIPISCVAQIGWTAAIDRRPVSEKLREFADRRGIEAVSPWHWERHWTKAMVSAAQEKLSLKMMKKWAERFNSFEDLSKTYSVYGVRPIMWHLTEEKGFRPRSDIRPSDVPVGRGTWTVKKGEGGLMAASDPSSWPPETLGERPYVAALDITGLVRGKDYTVVQRGYDEIYISRPEKVKVLKVYSRRSGTAAAKRLLREYPQSKQEMRAIWETVHGAE